MKKYGLITRVAIGALGGTLLVGGTGAAVAAEIDDDNVDVNVNIEALPPVGALTLTVAADSSTLVEVDSGDLNVRQFEGVLPTVAVTDDRSEVPVGQFWYVVGQSSALTSGANSIDADNLGWTPNLITAEGDGEVAAGPHVGTALDGDAGLSSGEDVLALALDSGEAAAIGEWSADANLFLKTPATVAPGAYSGTITLTLWEDGY
jgi:type 1 fimbria pilin